MTGSLHRDTVAVLTDWRPPDNQQAALRSHYLDHLAGRPDAMLRSCRPSHLTASAIVVDHSRLRVLLTLHATIGRWLQTGGHCEPTDPTLAAAALREATEESGIGDLRILGPPVRLSHHPVQCRPAANQQSTDAFHLDVQYVAIAPPGAVEQRSAESTALAWFGFDDLPTDCDADVLALAQASRPC